jgi:DNA-binding transcriptional LysR family regulator
MTEPAPLRNLNLNLLSHLDALLTCRSVSRAAGRLGLSQPTVSSALQRLRRHFGDDLLVRSGSASELTPLGIELRPLVSVALVSAERVFTSTTVFDPASARREFRLLATDYWVASVGSALAAAVAERGPAIRLRFARLDGAVSEHAVDVLRGVDGVLSPHGVLRGVPHRDLLRAEWVCVVDGANARVGAELSVADLAELPWVVVSGDASSETARSESLALRQLRQAGIEPDVAVTLDSYLAVPWFVAGSGRIAVVHRGLARRVAGEMGLRMLPCPVELRPLRVALWWHPQFDADTGHRWLRDLLRDVAADLSV